MERGWVHPFISCVLRLGILPRGKVRKQAFPKLGPHLIVARPWDQSDHEKAYLYDFQRAGTAGTGAGAGVFLGGIRGWKVGLRILYLLFLFFCFLG